jgi:putative membrane protein
MLIKIKKGGASMKSNNFIVRLLLNALAFLIVSKLYRSGFYVAGIGSAVIAALIWGFLNALLRPILVALTLPLNVLTLGLFIFVINGLILLITAQLYHGLVITSFFSGIIAAILLSIVNLILSRIV